MGKSSKKQFVWLFCGIAVVIVLLGWNSLSTLVTKGPGSAERVPCVNPLLPIPEGLHIHPELSVVVNGEKVSVPTNIGIELAGCHRVLHTHDETGTIHVEPNEYRPYTLGDFFYVWEKPLSKSALLDFSADAEHEVVMTIDGAPSTEFETLVLKDKQQIVLEYRAL